MMTVLTSVPFLGARAESPDANTRSNALRTYIQQTPDGNRVVCERTVANDLQLADDCREETTTGTDDSGVIWHRYHAMALYTSTAICMGDVSITAGTMLNPPYQAENIPIESAGIPNWIVEEEEKWQVAASRYGDVIAGVRIDDDGNAVLYKWSAGSDGTPDWSCELDSCRFNNTYALGCQNIAVADDGSRIAVCVRLNQDAPKISRLYYWNADSPDPQIIDITDATLPQNLLITEHGDFIAFREGTEIYVVDCEAASIRWTTNIGGMGWTLSISGDGNYLAYGRSCLYMLEWNGSFYEPLWTRCSSGHKINHCEFSADGSTLVAGWNSDDYLKNKIELIEMPSSTPIWAYDYETGSGSYQDIIADLAVTVNGEYIAVASWGDQINTNPEIHIFEHSSPTPILTVDTPGSMHCVDITTASDSVQYVTACGKHVHTNQSGRGGDLYSIRLTPLTTLCGDADGSGQVDIDDVVCLIQYMFAGGPALDSMGSADVDCSGDVDLDDAVYLIYYIFANGPAPCDPNGDEVPDC